MIEMLLVLAIISALAALLLAALFRANVFAQFVGGTNDISQLAVALENFKTKFGFYPPSRVKLCKRYADYSYWTTGGQLEQLEADSVFYLTKLAPRMTDSTLAAGAGTPPVPAARTKSPWMSGTPTTDPNFNIPAGQQLDFIDWDGSNVYTPPGPGTPPGFIVLEGDQCLVFFLGGMALNNAGKFTCDGFSQNPFNPALPRQSSSEQRTSFYAFDGARLFLPAYADYISPGNINNQISTTTGLVGAPNTFNNVFPSYFDQFGAKPFAYFSSYKGTNGYNRDFVANPPAPPPPWSTGPWCDCHGLGVWPYAQANITPSTLPGSTLSLTPITFANSDTFQLISAGPDKTFGPGTARNISVNAITNGASNCTLQAVPAFKTGQMVIVDVETPGKTEAVLVGTFSSSTVFQATFQTSHNANVSVIGPFWTKGTAGDIYPLGTKGGVDDVSNFSERPLGTTVATQ
jgi:general secretion pathway protein G